MGYESQPQVKRVLEPQSRRLLLNCEHTECDQRLVWEGKCRFYIPSPDEVNFSEMVRAIIRDSRNIPKNKTRADVLRRHLGASIYLSATKHLEDHHPNQPIEYSEKGMILPLKHLLSWSLPESGITIINTMIDAGDKPSRQNLRPTPVTLVIPEKDFFDDDDPNSFRHYEIDPSELRTVRLSWEVDRRSGFQVNPEFLNAILGHEAF